MSSGQKIYNEILCVLPEEFRSAISYYAYEKGHAYGYEEVLSYLEQLVDALKPCVEKYTQRIVTI